MKGFQNLLRVSVEDFNFLLEKVAPHITKKDTHLRKAISPKDRLSVTLRFLATGECAHKSNHILRPPFLCIPVHHITHVHSVNRKY